MRLFLLSSKKRKRAVGKGGRVWGWEELQGRIKESSVQIMRKEQVVVMEVGVRVLRGNFLWPSPLNSLTFKLSFTILRTRIMALFYEKS